MARDPFAELIERIAELERRQGNFIRKVKVTKNHDDGRVTVTDEAGFDPEPMGQMSMSSGGWKIDAPADVGSQGFVFCPEGDPSQARFFPCLPSDDQPHASTETGALRIKGPGGEILELKDGVFTYDGEMQLGASGGSGVARLGDKVQCPAGIGEIIESSNTVYAVD